LSRTLLMAGLGLLGTALLATAVVCLASGCTTLGYYAQAAAGHLEVLHRARPVAQLVQAQDTAAPLRQRLLASQRMRDFAVAELQLPDNASYRNYADLQRSDVVWNVVATPELSLTLKTWCFPVAGCVGYRGYYNQQAALAQAKTLQDQGLETRVYGVPAYSTLGYGNWAGGDPLLNTFIHWPDAELAKLIFHELSHQVAYAAGDTSFNESFATAVERLGLRRWLKAQAPGALGDAQAAQALQRVQAHEQRQQEFRTFTQQWRTALLALYSSGATDAEKRSAKAELMANMRSAYSAMKAQRWAGYAGYDAWFAGANNAHFGVLSAYNEWVPAFERLFEQQGADFSRFYAEVKRLAALPKEQRRAALEAATPLHPP
jgi:predicted aminopeptidase